MKKAKPGKVADIRAEYTRGDLGRLVRGKYAGRLATASNVVVLAPDVAAAFPNGEAVNDALRSLIRIASRVKRPKRGGKPGA
jgi:hypothetical protein